jgi:transcriptional regulator with XRE-family HTH domain
MPVMKSKSAEQIPVEVVSIAARLGERIRVARIRRKIRQGDLAARAHLSRSTIQAIERGEATCAVGSVLHLLWLLGLAGEVELIGDPGLDQAGLALSLAEGGRRVRVATKLNNEF